MAQTDILTRPSGPPDHVLRYGERDDQVADLRLPRPGGPAQPLVIFLHGGFWRSAYDRTHTGPLGEALAAAGYAVCTPEFRRTGQRGGGYPGTFDDIAAAVDSLPGLVADVAGPLSVGAAGVVLAGHSAGGHLALWAAGRRRLPAGDRWRAGGAGSGGGSGAGSAVGVVSLAGVCDLAACSRMGLGGGAADDLMGGGPDQFPDRYRSADPIGLVPTGVTARLVHGTADDRVPVQLSLDYVERAVAAGDDASCQVLAGCGHFEVIDPLSSAWPAVFAAFASAAGAE